MKQKSWAELYADWVPQDGKRSKGEQRQRWEDSLIQEMRISVRGVCSEMEKTWSFFQS